MKPICTAVIVAAGKGKRMGTDISKQFLPLCGREILAHTVQKFEQAENIRDIVLVTGADSLHDVRDMVQEYKWKNDDNKQLLLHLLRRYYLNRQRNLRPYSDNQYQ